jgi:hypothetical protein
MQAITQNPFLKYLFGFFPKLTTVILATVSFAIGMVFAYATIAFVNGDPSQLDQSWQNEWVRGLEARFRAPNNTADDPQNILGLLSAVDAPLSIVDTESIGTADFRALAEQAEEIAPPTPRGGSVVSNYVIPVLWVILFAIVYTLLFFLWAFLVWPYVRDIIRKDGDSTDAAAAAAQIDQIKKIKGLEKEMEGQSSTSEGATKYGEPVIQRISMYQAGFGNYDDSFNIETDEGMYYGETGGSISEKIGEGVAAVEVWLFDKDEFTNTPNAILASQHAYNDPAVKSRLDPKAKQGVFLAQPGTIIQLESGALYVEARVMTVEYDDTAETPNSVFKQLTFQLTAWSKGASAGGGAGIPPMPAATPMPTMPPPMPPAPSQPTPPMGGAPMPPPMPPAGGQQPPIFPPQPQGGSTPPQDPFGGTGDFTPVNPNR